MSQINLQEVLSNLRYILLTFEMCMRCQSIKSYMCHNLLNYHGVLVDWKNRGICKEIILQIIYIRWLHNSLVNPGLHPHSHCPFWLLQGELFRQLPLQLLTQLLPKVPSMHTRTQISQLGEGGSFKI